MANHLLAKYDQLKAVVGNDEEKIALLMSSEQESLQAQKDQQEMDQAAQSFMGLNFGVGLGVSVDLQSGSRVSSAKVVGDSKLVQVDDESRAQPRVFLEMHDFTDCIIHCPAVIDPDDTRMFGWGPWAGIQSSQDKIIDAFVFGLMAGWRRQPKESTSFNVGLGLVLDSNVQVLGDGIKKGQPLPAGETDVRFKKVSRLGAVLMTSFSF